MTLRMGAKGVIFGHLFFASERLQMRETPTFRLSCDVINLRLAKRADCDRPLLGLILLYLQLGENGVSVK